MLTSRPAPVAFIALAVLFVLLAIPDAIVLAGPPPGVPRGHSTPVPDATVRDDVRPSQPAERTVYGPLNPSALPPRSSPPPGKSVVLASRTTGSAAVAPRHRLTFNETDNILVLGVDHRPGGRMWRTDTIMIVAVDHFGRKVGIISVPRDLWVTIPGYGEGRINIADFYGEETGYPGGGPALVGQLLQEHLGITVHHWARIQQEGLVRLVDTMGGVTITLDCPLFEKTPHPTIPGEFEYLQLPAGETRLDGEMAKKFATYRYATTDFNRARRQQQLIWALRRRASETDMLPLIPQLWSELSETFETDLTLIDLLPLAALALELQGEDIRGLTFPRDALRATLVQGGNQVLVIADEPKLQAVLDGLFEARPLAELGRVATGACP